MTARAGRSCSATSPETRGPLAKKLGIKESHRVAFPSAPDSFGQKVRSGGAVNPFVILGVAALAAILIAALRRR